MSGLNLESINNNTMDEIKQILSKFDEELEMANKITDESYDFETMFSEIYGDED